MAIPYLIQGNNIVLVIGNNPHTISPSHIAFEKIKAAVKSQDWEAVKKLIEPAKEILNYGSGNIAIQGDKLFWKGTELHNTLATRLIKMYQEGFPIEPLVLFMENLMLNPSNRAVNELYSFLEKGSLPITPDGYFLAYKKVTKDYLDIHSKKISNKVGRVVEMNRNEVNDNSNETCSYGLHICSRDYLSHFGGSDDPVMILKVHPRDVVSIPNDYNSTKARVCRYEVIGEIGVNVDDLSGVVQTVSTPLDGSDYTINNTVGDFSLDDSDVPSDVGFSDYE